MSVGPLFRDAPPSSKINRGISNFLDCAHTLLGGSECFPPNTKTHSAGTCCIHVIQVIPVVLKSPLNCSRLPGPPEGYTKFPRALNNGSQSTYRVASRYETTASYVVNYKY